MRKLKERLPTQDIIGAYLGYRDKEKLPRNEAIKATARLYDLEEREVENFLMKNDVQEEKKEETIFELQDDLRIPGTKIILEKGDRIKIIEEKKNG